MILWYVELAEKIETNNTTLEKGKTQISLIYRRTYYLCSYFEVYLRNGWATVENWAESYEENELSQGRLA